jgi:Na+/H+ antiporter NhaD/arsenite permease-like protein
MEMTLSSGSPEFPWAVIAVWIYIVFLLFSETRSQERQRQAEGRPHTIADTALLLLSGLSVVGVFLCAAFFKPLAALARSRAGIGAIIVVVGGGLTYIFNRNRPQDLR